MSDKLDKIADAVALLAEDGRRLKDRIDSISSRRDETKAWTVEIAGFRKSGDRDGVLKTYRILASSEKEAINIAHEKARIAGFLSSIDKSCKQV